jgi:hypothetical protein
VTDGRALVQAGIQIDIGYEVSLPNPGSPGFSATPRIVASIDRTTREITKEWLITWGGSRQSAPADAPLLCAQLPPEWFSGRLLRWMHETAGTSGVVVDLAGFGERDVPVDSVITLAEHLASDGLVNVDSSNERATATLTRDGVDAAERAAAVRADSRQRAQALRQRMITWLAGRENASDTPHDWKAFLHDPRSTFYGGFFTIHELAREAHYLAEHGLIRGLGGRDGDDLGWTRPRLTAKGRDCNDDYGGDMTKSLKPEPPAGSTRIKVDASPGTQINVGDHNSQHASPVSPSVSPEPTAEKTAWWRAAWHFLNSLTGIVVATGTVVLVILTYLLLHQH